MDTVSFGLQVVHADGTLGIHVRCRVGVQDDWKSVVIPKINAKIAAARAEGEETMQQDGEDVANAVFACRRGARILEAEDIDNMETVYALFGGAAVPGSSGA